LLNVDKKRELYLLSIFDREMMFHLIFVSIFYMFVGCRRK